MPLFACSSCDTVENTATGDYWNRREAPLCSSCSPRTGRWHGLFPRMPAGDGSWIPDPDMDGFLVRRSPG
jgi:hypothetical protein